MNYGALYSYETGKNTECLWVNTLPNNTILLQYNNQQEVCKIVDKLKKLDISFSRSKNWDFIPIKIFGTNGYNKCLYEKPFDYADYSPVVYMFTNNGEYGYSQLTVYMNDGCADIKGGIVLDYEHQYKGGVFNHYYKEKTNK